MDSYDDPPPPRRDLGDTLIFHCLNDLACLWYVHTKRMAKLDRYTLGQKIFELLIDMLVLVVRAQYQSNEKKLQILYNTSEQLDTIKILIRLTHKIEMIPEATYIRFQTDLQNIGKMLGGWIRDEKSKSPTKEAPA